MLAMSLAAARHDVQDGGAAGARSTCGRRALDLRDPLAGRRACENIPPARRSPHIVLSKHSSTWETLSLTQYFPPLAYVAKKELLSIPFFGWGFAIGVADHHRPQGRHGRNAADRNAGTRALRAGLLDRHLSRGNAHSGGHAREVQDRRRATRARRSTCRSSRSRTTPAICGRRALFGKQPGTITMSIGKPITPTGKEPLALMQEVEALDRRRGRATGVSRRDARAGPPRTCAWTTITRGPDAARRRATACPSASSCR